MQLSLTKHGKKQLKKRVHKNVSKAFKNACEKGIPDKELDGDLLEFANHIFDNHKPDHAELAEIILWQYHMYLIADDKLITVIAIPGRLNKQAERVMKGLNND